MTNNVGLTISDTTSRFTISIEQDKGVGDTKYHISVVVLPHKRYYMHYT